MAEHPVVVRAKDLSCQGLQMIDPDRPIFYGVPVEGFHEELEHRGEGHVYGCELIGHGRLKVSEIQSGVADLIEKRGLCKKTFVPDEDTDDLATCPLCVLAAFNAAVGGPALVTSFLPDAKRAARAFADWLGIDPERDLIEALGDEWNDRPEQTQANVVRQIRRCSAELARAGQ